MRSTMSSKDQEGRRHHARLMYAATSLGRKLEARGAARQGRRGGLHGLRVPGGRLHLQGPDKRGRVGARGQGARHRGGQAQVSDEAVDGYYPLRLRQRDLKKAEAVGPLVAGNGTTFHLPGDDQPSLPHMFQEMPGRKYHHFSHVQNMKLQEKSGSASTKRAVAVATSRVRLLLFFGIVGGLHGL